MNFKKCVTGNPVSVFLKVMVLAAVLVAAPARSQAQIDENVLKFGPNFDVLNRQTVELEVLSWKWQVRFIEKQQELVSETRAKWMDTLEESRNEASKLQAMLTEKGLPAALDSESVRELDEEIRDLQSKAIGVKARLEQQKAVSETEQSHLKYELQVKELELENRMASLQAAQTQLANTGKLLEGGFTTAKQLADLEAQVMRVENEIAIARLNLEQTARRLSGQQKASDLRAMSEEYEAVVSLQRDLRQKREFLQSTRILQKIEMLRFQSDMALQMMEIAETRNMELVLENVRYQALIQLTEEKLAASKESSDER